MRPQWIARCGRRMRPFRRGAIVRRTSVHASSTACADLIDAKRDLFAKTIAREAGKALKHATGEVSRSIETFRFAAEEAKRLHGETVPMDASTAGEQRMGFYLRFPLGVVAAITPFNFPLNLVAHKVGPALAAGNCIVLKPAEETPLTAVLLGDVLAEAGLPTHVFELVHGDGPTTGEALVTHPVPAKVSFTGSPPVGARILQSGWAQARHAGARKQLGHDCRAGCRSRACGAAVCAVGFCQRRAGLHQPAAFVRARSHCHGIHRCVRGGDQRARRRESARSRHRRRSAHFG